MGVVKRIELTTEQRDTILRVATGHGARNIRAFGSVVRGNASKESDLDLLVDMAPGRSLLDLIAIEQDLEDQLRVRVDVLTAAGLSPYMREEVLREAVAL